MSTTPPPPDDTEVNEAIADAEDLNEALFWLADKYGADVTNNYPGWREGVYLRHVGDFTAEVKAQFERFPLGPSNDTVTREAHVEVIESERWESAYWHLCAIERSRVWIYRGGTWRGWPQISSDEYGRRTLVLGLPFVGAVVFALWRCRCEDCTAELQALRAIVDADPTPDGTGH